MSNKHPSKLGYLMDTFGITNKELAKVLHIDYTLVSKWRNHKRKLSPRSKYLDQIVSFFLEIDKHEDFKTLKKILHNEQLQDLNTKKINIYKTLLKKWIVSDHENMNENLLKILDKRGSYTVQVEVLQGNGGRRLVSRKFADVALSLPPGQELLLYSQSSQTSWITEDKQYSKSWKDNYLKVLHKGSTIHLVHSIAREPSSLIAVLLEWLPLDLTGNLTSYYYPQFSDQALEPTINVIKNQAAFFSLFHKGHDTFYTLFFTDPVTVKQAELIVRELISQCRTLYNRYGLQQISKILQELAITSTKRENSYYYANLPFFCLLFAKFLTDNNNNESDKKTVYALQEVFMRNLKNNNCKIILNYDMLMTMLKAGERQPSKLTFENPEFKSMFCNYLQQFTVFLEKLPNLEIALTEKLPTANTAEVSMYIQENTIAMINAFIPFKNDPITLITHEPSIIQAYYWHYKNFWSHLPSRDKDKSRNISVLKNMVKKFKSAL